MQCSLWAVSALASGNEAQIHQSSLTQTHHSELTVSSPRPLTKVPQQCFADSGILPILSPVKALRTGCARSAFLALTAKQRPSPAL
jgi:hypothetical protein